MNHWLMKSEPGVFALADLKRCGVVGTPWDGVRNYQARNFMRAMNVGDLALFYHSNCPEPGVVGSLRVIRTAYPDATALEPAHHGYDPGSTVASPRWDCVDVAWQSDFEQLVSLDRMRAVPELCDLLILRRGSRLSVTPLSAAEFRCISRLGGVKR